MSYNLTIEIVDYNGVFDTVEWVNINYDKVVRIIAMWLDKSVVEITVKRAE